MPPKKKLSKKEKARLEAEQAEQLRIEMEKEKQRKLEEERQRRQVEREQAKRRLQEEIAENKQRRAQLKNSMKFFDTVKETIDEILNKAREQSDWDKYMRCNGLPNANIPSDLRKYMHQWKADIELRNRDSRNWLLRTDERTLLTHDENVENLTREHLRKQQGCLGHAYAVRIKEALGILSELDQALLDKSKAARTTDDLRRLKIEIRIFLGDYLDEFTYRLLSYIERDMDIDRPGVCKHIFDSFVFKSHLWTFAKDAQISINPKSRIGDQNHHNDIEFPIMELNISLPPTVKLPCSAIRGLWLSYDHLSDNCSSFELKRHRPGFVSRNVLVQTKKEWHKRKEILQSMLDDCAKESTFSNIDSVGVSSSQKQTERGKDVDKLYTEYEDELSKARRRAIGPESFNLSDVDVNLRKYRIIGGVYCVDYLETPQQDKKLNSRSFIRTIDASESLLRKNFYQTYKPPPPAQPGVRRLPEEIEAEMRMMEAALEKLALVSVQLSNAVIWFEPPIVCRWETVAEALESQLAEAKLPQPHSQSQSQLQQQAATATPTEITPRSTTTNNLSPLKSSPRKRKRSSQRTSTAPSIREVDDFDMNNIPSSIDIYGLIKDFVVPRLPQGFSVRLNAKGGDKQTRQAVNANKVNEQAEETEEVREALEAEDAVEVQRVVFYARLKSINTARPTELKQDSEESELVTSTKWKIQPINEDYLDLGEPREFFPHVEIEKVLKIRGGTPVGNLQSQKFCEIKEKIQKNKTENKNENENRNANGNGNGNANANLNAPVGGCETEDKIKNINRNGNENENKNGNNTKFGSSSENSRRSSEEAQTATIVQRTRYMFSELLEDLDRLCERQMPFTQQEEMLKKISAQLASSTSSIGSNEAAAAKDNEPTTTTTMEAFSYYPGMGSGPGAGAGAGISFMRDLEIETTKKGIAIDIDNKNKNKNNTKNKNKQKNNNIISDDADNDESSSSDWDDDAYDNEDDDYYYGAGFGIESAEDEICEASDAFNDGSGGGGSSQNGKAKKSHMETLAEGKWSIRDVHDTKFNEDKLCIQFRTGRLGIFGFALNRYSNMPYQTWEIKPDLKSPGTILFSFTASIVSLDMTITTAGYCVNNFQGGTTDAINEMIGKTFSLPQLKDILIASAVDIFPEEDAFCYTEGSCEKNFIMEMHLYECMSTLAQSHNFSWSRWNLLAGSRTAILLIREILEGKKVPNYSTLWVTPLKSAIIECTEVSASFNAVGIPGMEYYADLYQLSQMHAQPSSLEKQRKMDPVLRDNVAQILMAIRPLSFC